MGLGLPVQLFVWSFTDKSGLGKNEQKMLKNGPEMGFFSYF